MKYKYNGQWVDVNIKALDSMVIGSVIDFAGKEEKIPVGWLICDGSAISRTEYSELFDVIGTKWGTGDGSTTFNVPPAGIVRVGYDANDTDFNAVGKTGGSKYIQNHSHIGTGIADTTLSSWSNSGSGNVFDMSSLFRENVANNNMFTSGEVEGNKKGNSGNLQPYGTFYSIIKAKNTTPTMASVVNATNNSTTDTYSCDYENKHYGGVVLFSDDSGKNTGITLSETIANYNSVEIFYKSSDGIYSSTGRIYTPSGKPIEMTASYNMDNTIYNKQARITISTTTATISNERELFVYSGGYGVNTGTYFYVLKIVGYK